MSLNGTFDLNSFTGFDNNNLGHDNSSTADDLFNAFDWGNNTGVDLYTDQHAGPSTRADEWYLHQSPTGGPGQPYTGVEVLGGLNGFPDLDDPTTAPTTLCPANQVSLGEGKPCFPLKTIVRDSPFIIGHNSPFHSGMAMPTFSPQPATIPPFPTNFNPSPAPCK